MKRSRTVALGVLPLFAATFLTGCADTWDVEPEAPPADTADDVDAQPVCGLEHPDGTVEVRDPADCDRVRDGGGGAFFWWLYVPGHYPPGSRHPVAGAHSKVDPKTVPAGYGRPGSVVKVPSRAGFGGSAGRAGSGSGG